MEIVLVNADFIIPTYASVSKSIIGLKYLVCIINQHFSIYPIIFNGLDNGLYIIGVNTEKEKMFRKLVVNKQD